MMYDISDTELNELFECVCSGSFSSFAPQKTIGIVSLGRPLTEFEDDEEETEDDD